MSVIGQQPNVWSGSNGMAGIGTRCSTITVLPGSNRLMCLVSHFGCGTVLQTIIVNILFVVLVLHAWA